MLELDRSSRGERFLNEAARLLGESLDYPRTLASVAELAVPTLADWCIVDVVGSGGRLRRVALAYADPSKGELARRSEQWPAFLGASSAETTPAGQPILVPEPQTDP